MKPSHSAATASSLSILEHGHGWLAVDKPAGVSVHNDPDKREDLLAWVRRHLKNDLALKKSCGWREEVFAPAPVHRLDRETSGVMLIAVDLETARQLQQQMEERSRSTEPSHTQRKLYRAIVRGSVRDDQGEWVLPLSDKAEGRKNPAGLARERKTCRTLFRKQNQNAHLTDLEIELITGRQHQIRRHCTLAKHAILGDTRYGDPKYNAKIQERFGIQRMLLHAWRLEFTLDKSEYKIEAPLPLEFAQVFIDNGASS